MSGLTDHGMEGRRVNEGLQRYVELASDLTRTTLGTTERVLAQFVRQGEVAAEHAERLVDEVVARSIAGSDALAQLIRSEVEQAVERAGYVRAEEVDGLRREIDNLRARLVALNGDVPATGGSERP
jgi:polyhydroxyalkanoate synthesis regulator phasin